MGFNAQQFRTERYAHKRIVVMGYGVYATGSGIAATEYLAKAGANVLVVDLRSPEILAENMARLSHYENIEWKVGVEHDDADFKNADIVIKNPGVRHDSPYLKLAKVIESDISLFLREYHAMQETNQYKHHLVAVSGSKGKSSTVALLHHLLGKEQNNVFLAGNITVSPLFHLERLSTLEQATLILELSSWQLADLRNKNVLHPDIALLTNLMADHLNYYNNDMLAYAKDKVNLFLEQDCSDYALFDLEDVHTPYFVSHAKARCGFYHSKQLSMIYTCGAYWKDDYTLVLRQEGVEQEAHFDNLPYYIIKSNLSKAFWMGSLLGIPIPLMQQRLDSYEGLIYRCQVIAKTDNLRFINDSAATIPEATVSAIENFHVINRSLILILGGADKGSDVSILEHSLKKATYIYLLEGTASHILEKVIQKSATSYQAHCDSFEQIVTDFMQKFGNIEADLLLSPAVASFGLFKNEFDRGQAFDKAVVACISQK